ncbi:MAG: chemotaxis protein CheW [bacterium]|nr:MAG: chemotaxis protein CheW [bacterium]
MSTAALSETGTGSDSKVLEDLSGKYLSFIIGKEEYGIEILSVNEIISIIEITSIPNLSDYVKGVINLRGSVIPIVDLRMKFGMPEKEYDKETCIIVVNLHGRLMGIIVDTVSEVLDITEEDIDSSLNFGISVEIDFILGMGKVKDKVVILLVIERVLQSKQLAAIHSAAKELNKMEENNV